MWKKLLENFFHSSSILTRSILSRKLLIGARESVAKSQLESWRVHQWMENDDGVDFVWIFRRQCGDEADPCSEAENFSVEETTLTTSTTTTAGTTTSTRKVTGSRSNEISLHYFALTYSTFSRRSRKDMARLQTRINIPTLSLSLTFRKDKNVLSFNRLVN